MTEYSYNPEPFESDAVTVVYGHNMLNDSFFSRLKDYQDETFRQEVAKAAAHLAENVSPRSLRIIKRQLYEGTHSTLAESVHRAEDELQGCLESDDFREGVTHFIEKRAARFTGR